MVLKPANKYQIIWQCHNFKSILIDGFQHHPLRTNCKDKMIQHSNLHLLFDLLRHQKGIS